MGKTIKDLAIEDAKYWCSTPGSEGTKEELVAIGYMRGANAVIQEIEKITNAVLKGSNWPEYAFDEIVEKIKQLKGE